jgi:hypothetical protein
LRDTYAAVRSVRTYAAVRGVSTYAAVKGAAAIYGYSYYIAAIFGYSYCPYTAAMPRIYSSKECKLACSSKGCNCYICANLLLYMR